MSPTLRGSLYVIAACLVWSIGNIVSKYFLTYLPPIPMTVVSALVIAITLLVFRRGAAGQCIQALRQSPRDFLILAVVAVCLGSICYYLAMVHMPVSLAASLLRLQPLFILLFAGIWLHEKLHTSQYVFVISAFGGAALLLWPKLSPLFMEQQAVDLMPLLFVLISVIGFSIATIQGKRLSNMKYPPSVMIILRFGIGGIICLPLLLLTPIAEYANVPWWAWAAVACSAIFSTTVGFTLYYRGLPHISASLSGFMEQFSPIFTIIMGALILHEQLLAIQYVGAAVLIVSMGMLGYLEHRAKIIDEIIA